MVSMDAREVMDVCLPGGVLFADRKGRTHEPGRPLAPLADTHGHLTSLRHMDASVAVARAALAGVRLLVVPVDPTDDVGDVARFLSWFDETLDGARRMLEVLGAEGMCPDLFEGEGDACSLPDNTWYVAGVHPYGAERLMGDAEARRRLEALLAGERCVGVGEFGVDFGPYNKLGAHVQEEAFRYQLRLAHEHALPVELHLRNADADLAAQGHALARRVLEEEGVPRRGLDLHCFTSGPDVLAPFVELGCHAAFGGAVTFSRSDGIRAAYLSCPADRVLTETDCPYMTPVPLRGMRCEPAMVAFTAALMADVRADMQGTPREQTYEALWNNALAFFGLSWQTLPARRMVE